MTPTDPANPDAKPPADPAAKPDAPVVPDTYTFKTTDGAAPDKALTEAAAPIFKELGLTQAQADKLIDLYNGQTVAKLNNAASIIAEQGRAWETQVRADPELGPNLDRIKVDVGRALERLPAADRTKFQSAMDQTMAGNNPDIIRGVWKLAQLAAPGTPVSGSGPSVHGQSASGQTNRPSVAGSLWPTLPKAS